MRLQSAGRLPKRFVDENFSFFSQTLRGVKEQPVRWKTCVATADGTVGEALGAEYVKRAYARSKKTNGRTDQQFVCCLSRTPYGT